MTSATPFIEKDCLNAGADYFIDAIAVDKLYATIVALLTTRAT